ncbi:hypothetical protein [Corynebacterium anserum]|uniref:hypothetical protein n=1 Tax=Corynebacterium anserum TaxID=2684406 RepID=UPI001C8DD346|nr:hypothetical protein [Corynebacterium anserum]
MIHDLIATMTEFVQSLPTTIQWGGVMLSAAIPFVESYGASGIGVIVGVHPVLACAAAIIGNVISMLIAVNLSHLTRTGLTKNTTESRTAHKRARLKKLFDRFGVAVVSLIGQTVLPSQITSAAMVGFGASKRSVIIWQIVSIILWGVVFTLAATGLLRLV